jgi:DNA repair exonuclease SbcCD ATPase subunit
MTHVGMFEEAWLNDENKALKKRIKELEGINKQHQKLNGELQQENKRLKEYIDKLSEERDNFETLAKQK